MFPRSSRRLGALPVLLAVAVSLTACDTSDEEEAAAAVEEADRAVVTDPDDDATVEVEDTDGLAVVEGSEDAEEDLLEAVAATRERDVRARFDAAAASGVGTDGVAGEGVATDDGLQATMTVRGALAEAYGGLDTEAEVRTVDGTVYLRFPALLATADVEADWLSSPAGEAGEGAGDLISRARLVDPAEALALLEAPTAVADLGEEFVGEQATTHYLATVELGAAVEVARIGSDLFAEVEGGEDRLIEVHAYVGDDGLVRRMEARMETDGAELTILYEVLEADVDGVIETPPAANTITYDEFVAARSG